MKKILAILLIIIVAVCLAFFTGKHVGEKEVNEIIVTNTTEEVKETTLKDSLLEFEWKVNKAYKLNDIGRATEEVYPSDVYGKHYMQGGITFKEDGTFLKAISIYAEESKGTYTLDEDLKTITFKFDDGSVVEAGFEVEDNKIVTFQGAFEEQYAVVFAEEAGEIE